MSRRCSTPHQRQAGEIDRAAPKTDEVLGRNEDVVLYRSRQLISGDDAASSLAIGQRVSDSLVAIVRAITARPRYLRAKGGITSSDVATKGLDVKRARCWGRSCRACRSGSWGPRAATPAMPYIVFPGNVGGPGALAEIVELLEIRD